MKRCEYFGAMSGESFVDRVIEDFTKEVMKSARSCVADVHRRALAYGFQALQDLDIFRCVIGLNRLAHLARIFGILRLFRR